MKRILWVMLFLCAFALYAEVLFFDNFERAEGSAVGNSWTNIGPVSPVIENGSMKVTANSLQGVRRDFTSLGITSGIYYISYDWKISSNNWLADAFPNGTITYLRHDYEGNLYYDNTSDFSDPITFGCLEINTWVNIKLQVNINTDRFSVWINNSLVVDNVAGLAVADFTRFTFRAGSGSTVTQYIDNFIVYNDTPPATPSSLTAVGAVNNITLNWAGTPQDFLTYKIYRRTTSPADIFLAEVPGTQTSYVDNTAAANTDYFYRVKAVSMNTIESGYSNEYTAHLQPDLLVAPPLLNLTIGEGYVDSTYIQISNEGNYPLTWSTHINVASLSGIPLNNLIAYYPFNSNVNDVSGNNNSVNVTGLIYTADRFGNPYSALDVRQNDNITFGYPLPPNEKTLSFWIKSNRPAQSGVASDFSIGSSGSGALGSGFRFVYGFTYVQDLGHWGCGGSHDCSIVSNSNKWSSNGLWHHIVATMTSSNKVWIYVDGVRQMSLRLQDPATTVNELSQIATQGLLGIYGPIFPYSHYILVDDLAIYDRALSDSEIQTIYTSNNVHPYLSLSSGSGVLQANSTEILSLSLNAANLSEGVYTDTLFVNSSDPETSSIPIIINLNVVPGDIDVTPAEFTVKLNSASNTANAQINITNTGQGKLNYSISGTDDYHQVPTIPPISGFTAIGVFNEHRYYKSNSTMTWTAAKQLCEQNGGHLVTISSAAENSFCSSTSPMWIGLTDQVAEGVYLWVTGEPLVYTNWGLTQPDNSGGLEDYVEINWNNSGWWNDSSNSGWNGNVQCIMEIDNVVGYVSMLSFSPNSGILDTSSYKSIATLINGSDLSDGIYQTSAMIMTNAPEPRDTLYIPVTVKVDFTPPTAPVGLEFNEVLSDMDQISLSWTANALADSVYHYKVYRRGIHDTLWSLKGIVRADHPWFMDDQFTGLDTTAVYYKITAVDWVDNESVASGEVMAWLQRFPAPTGLTMEIIRNRHVKLTWDPVDQTISGNPGTPSCYVIYRSNTPSPIEDYYFVAAVDATTYTHNWAAWFIESNKQFYVVTAYSGNFDDLRAIADSRRQWKYGELEQVLKSRGTKTRSAQEVVQ